jgi:hypothetical protein
LGHHHFPGPEGRQTHPVHYIHSSEDENKKKPITSAAAKAKISIIEKDYFSLSAPKPKAKKVVS